MGLKITVDKEAILEKGNYLTCNTIRLQKMAKQKLNPVAKNINKFNKPVTQQRVKKQLRKRNLKYKLESPAV